MFIASLAAQIHFVVYCIIRERRWLAITFFIIVIFLLHTFQASGISMVTTCCQLINKCDGISQMY